MENEKEFWNENCIIAIDPSGKFKSVSAKENEEAHWQLYFRLNKKLGGIMGEIKPWNRSMLWRFL